MVRLTAIALALSIYTVSAARSSSNVCDEMCRTPSGSCGFYPSLSSDRPDLEELFCAQACQISGDQCVQGSSVVAGVCEEMCKPWDAKCVFYPPQTLSSYKVNELYCNQFCCNGGNGGRTNPIPDEKIITPSAKQDNSDDDVVPNKPVEPADITQDSDDDVQPAETTTTIPVGKPEDFDNLKGLEDCYQTKSSKPFWNPFAKETTGANCPETEWGGYEDTYHKAVKSCWHLYESGKCRKGAAGGLEMRRQIAIKELRNLDTSLELPHPYTCQVATLCMKTESKTAYKLVKVKVGQNQDKNRSLCQALDDGTWDEQVLTCIPKVAEQ